MEDILKTIFMLSDIKTINHVRLVSTGFCSLGKIYCWYKVNNNFYRLLLFRDFPGKRTLDFVKTISQNNNIAWKEYYKKRWTEKNINYSDCSNSLLYNIKINETDFISSQNYCNIENDIFSCNEFEEEYSKLFWWINSFC